jgi:hypothetical protein
MLPSSCFFLLVFLALNRFDGWWGQFFGIGFWKLFGVITLRLQVFIRHGAPRWLVRFHPRAHIKITVAAHLHYS